MNVTRENAGRKVPSRNKYSWTEEEKKNLGQDEEDGGYLR